MKKLLLLSLSTFLIANFSFADWTFLREKGTKVRGGTTTGIPTKKDEKPSKHWQQLKKSTGKIAFENDRLAILNLIGEYEVSFEFLETYILETTKKIDQPYFSGATEIVTLLEDKNDFISLQHTLVMFFKSPDGKKPMDPMIVKHWRQDWQWQPTQLIEFQGDNTWKKRLVKAAEAKNKWGWNVYQVDDSPRYSAIGKWDHFKTSSIFATDFTNRPLPRREFSVRSDYKLLLGRDEIVVHKKGWFHEQKNFKQKDSATDVDFDKVFLSRELGINTYKRIKQFDFSAGYENLKDTEKYWVQVRKYWDNYFIANDKIQLKKSYDGYKLYQKHFANAKDQTILSKSDNHIYKIVEAVHKSFTK